MATQKTTNRIDFVDGPSRDELFLALRLYIDPQGNRTVTFIGKDGFKYLASIVQLGWEDGSGHSWLIEGYIDTRQERSQRFKGSFNTGSPRHGSVEILT